MTLTLFGATLVIVGVAYLAAKRMSRGQAPKGRHGKAESADRLEPTNGAGVARQRSNWPGLVLVTVGAALLLTAAIMT